MSEHTPGPWFAEKDEALGAYMIRTVANEFIRPALVYNLGSRGETEPNAHLVAAAPNLLGGLKDLVEQCRGGHMDLDPYKDIIAKAEGRTE